MVNPFREIDWHPDRLKLREFGLVLFIGFALVSTALALAELMHAAHPTIGIRVACGVLAVLGMFCRIVPSIAKPFYLVWYFIGACIGIVMSNLLLMALYFTVLTPVALIFRLMGRDALHRRFDPKRESYWEVAEAKVDPARYFRQF